MYASFFGLNEKPFAITPDPRYLYLGPRHAEALAHLLYGITESGGFIQLTGEVGTGKTTVVRSLLEQLPPNTEVALVLNPRLSPLEFLLAICDELHIEVLDRSSPKAIIDGLNHHLLQAHAAGRRVVLIVDEAQNLSTEVLEQIRLLTNLETAKQKLLQIILVGQPELRELLARSDLRQLAQRITGRYHLEPFEAEELRAYVRHRLEVAGGRGEIFTASAIRELHRSSDGIPRLVNVIADRALLGAWSHETPTVDAKMARQAAQEVFGDRIKRQVRRAPGVAALLLGAAGVVIVVLAVAVFMLLQREPVVPARSVESSPPAAARLPATTPVMRPQRSEPAPPAAETTPVPEPAPVAAPVPATMPGTPALDPAAVTAPLGVQLAAGGLATGTDTAFGNLFARWGMAYRPEDGPACEQAAAQGTRCLLQRGTWGELAVLDRPVIMVLADTEGREHQVVLSRLTGGAAEILAGDQRMLVPLGELLTLWFGEYLMLWRPEAGEGRALSRNATGTDVLWLRRALGELRGAPVLPADSTAYDPAMEAAVRDFQRDARLAVDGIAGAMTLITVNNALALPGRPRLLEAE
jgi:general secretion pathway protein A